MQSTTNYGLNIVEGTDIVNPLTQFNPNFTTIDGVMKDNSDAAIDHATCIKTGTVHAITRTNSDASVFRFTATGNWNTGDTMTVDGTIVSVYATDGTALADGCFVINTEVLAAIQGTRVTVYCDKSINGAAFASAGSIAPVEVSPSLHAYAIGDHFMFNGVRYKATASISIGDTITPGTNCTAESVETSTRIKYKDYSVTIGTGTGAEPFTNRGNAALVDGITIDRVIGMYIISGTGVIMWDENVSRLRICSSTDTTLKYRIVYI